MNGRSRVDAVFFDAGETILRPHPSFVELFAATCRAEGLDVTAEQVADVRERLAPDLLDLIREAEQDGHLVGAAVMSGSEDESRAYWIYLYTRFLRELGIDDEGLAERLFATFRSVSSYKLYDDVEATLDRLRGAGYDLGLISNFERWLEQLLVELEVGRAFRTTVISGVEGVAKPDPAIFELALERAGVDASRAVYIGDSPEMDIRPATAVGMSAVLLDRAGRHGGAGGHVISSLSELPEVLEHL